MVIAALAPPAAASWVSAVRPALVVGLAVPSLALAALNGSADPWLFAYDVLPGVRAGLTAILLIPAAAHVGVVVLVRVRERRARTAGPDAR